jgi:hypothetical protein
LYQHGDIEHHVCYNDGHGCNDIGLANGSNGKLDGECGDHYGHAFGIGDLHLYGDDDGWVYGWNQYSNGHDYGNAEQYDCEELGGGYGCADALYQHGDHEYHLRYNYSSGSNGNWLADRSDGQLELERGDHYGYALGIGDLHLHGDDVGGLHGWHEYSNRYDYGDAEQYDCVEFGSGNQFPDALY